MNYQITSDNIELSESMKTLAQEKLAKLNPRLKNIPEELKSCRVVMNSAPLEQFAVKLELTLKGKMFFTDERNYNLETALILAVEELERQLEKNWSKEDEKAWEERRESKRVDEEDLITS